MTGPGRIELTAAQVEDLIGTIERSNLPEEKRKLVVDLITAIQWMNQSLEEKRLSIRRLQKIFGIQTEKTSHLLKTIEADLDQRAEREAGGRSAPATVAADKGKGHGRLSAEEYVAAQTVNYSHSTLKPGVRCPGCERGNLCALPSGKILRITACPPLQATLHRVLSVSVRRPNFLKLFSMESG